MEMAGFYAVAAVAGTCYYFNRRGLGDGMTRSVLQIPCQQWSTKGWPMLSYSYRKCGKGGMPRLQWFCWGGSGHVMTRFVLQKS